MRFVTQKSAVNAEANSGADPIAAENEKQEQLLDSNIREESDNKSTINQVF
jgi:hypothetical protein